MLELTLKQKGLRDKKFMPLQMGIYQELKFRHMGTEKHYILIIQMDKPPYMLT